MTPTPSANNAISARTPGPVRPTGVERRSRWSCCARGELLASRCGAVGVWHGGLGAQRREAQASTRPAARQTVLGLKPDHGGAGARTEAAVHRARPVAAAQQTAAAPRARGASRSDWRSRCRARRCRPTTRAGIARRRRARAWQRDRGSRARAIPPTPAGHCWRRAAAERHHQGQRSGERCQGPSPIHRHLQEFERVPAGAERRPRAEKPRRGSARALEQRDKRHRPRHGRCPCQPGQQKQDRRHGGEPQPQRRAGPTPPAAAAAAPPELARRPDSAPGRR